MISKDQEPSVETCCPPESPGQKERSGWLMAIPVIGVLFCCGGPVIGAWLASAGLLAVLGSWWAGAGHWVLLVLAVVLIGGMMAWGMRRRATRRFRG